MPKTSRDGFEQAMCLQSDAFAHALNFAENAVVEDTQRLMQLSDSVLGMSRGLLAQRMLNKATQDNEVREYTTTLAAWRRGDRTPEEPTFNKLKQVLCDYAQQCLDDLMPLHLATQKTAHQDRFTS